jgi:hypothetical protein
MDCLQSSKGFRECLLHGGATPLGRKVEPQAVLLSAQGSSRSPSNMPVGSISSSPDTVVSLLCEACIGFNPGWGWMASHGCSTLVLCLTSLRTFLIHAWAHVKASHAAHLGPGANSHHFNLVIASSCHAPQHMPARPPPCRVWRWSTMPSLSARVRRTSTRTAGTTSNTVVLLDQPYLPGLPPAAPLLLYTMLYAWRADAAPIFLATALRDTNKSYPPGTHIGKLPSLLWLRVPAHAGRSARWWRA